MASRKSWKLKAFKLQQSLKPLRQVIIIIIIITTTYLYSYIQYLKQTMFLRYIVLQLFCNLIFDTLCVSCWTANILQDDTRSLQYLVNNCPTGKENTYI